jgi:hypothetical protein
MSLNITLTMNFGQFQTDPLPRNHITWSCELVNRGVYGVEAVIFRDVDFFISRRFENEALAAEWGGGGNGSRCSERRALDMGQIRKRGGVYFVTSERELWLLLGSLLRELERAAS